MTGEELVNNTSASLPFSLDNSVVYPALSLGVLQRDCGPVACSGNRLLTNIYWLSSFPCLPSTLPYQCFLGSHITHLHSNLHLMVCFWENINGDNSDNFCLIMPLLGKYPKEIIFKKEGGVITKILQHFYMIGKFKTI